MVMLSVPIQMTEKVKKSETSLTAALTTTTTLSTSMSNLSKHANVHFQAEESGPEIEESVQQKVMIKSGSSCPPRSRADTFP